jgi:hypothetical protein
MKIFTFMVLMPLLVQEYHIKKVDYHITKKNVPVFVHCLPLVVLLEPQIGGYMVILQTFHFERGWKHFPFWSSFTI